MKTLRSFIKDRELRGAAGAAAMILLLPCAAAALSLGSSKEDAGRPGAFLDYAASARSLGMGRAYTAVADDASAAYWNPSGLAQFERNDIVALYSALEEDSGYGFFSYAQPVPRIGTLGVGVVSLHSRGFEKRNEEGEKIGSADFSETGFLVSQGLRVNRAWSMGTTLKIIRQDIDAYSDTGYGADVGLMWALGKRWQTGLNIKNVVAPKLALKSESETYPRTVKTGVRWQGASKWLLSTDLTQTQGRDARVTIGTEWRPQQLFALRGGFNDAELFAGLGVNMGDWNIDYAFGYRSGVSGMESLGSFHRIGFHVRFGRDIHVWARSLRKQQEGQRLLAALRKMMDAGTIPSEEEMQAVLSRARKAVEEKAYPKPQDLYEVQGYITFFEKNYHRSVAYLGEALDASPAFNAALKARHEKALASLNAKQRVLVVRSEMNKLKEFFDAGKYQETLQSCRNILEIDPSHAEALTYWEDAKARLREPIDRAIKIAEKKMAQKRYLEAIPYLNDVRALDPTNKKAMAYMKEAIQELKKEQRRPVELLGSKEVPLDPEKSRSLYSQGLNLYATGDVKGALAMWQEAVRYDTTNIGARNAYDRALRETE